MDLELSGKVALVTGASSGIGRATAIALAAEGVQVVGVSRRPPDQAQPRITHFGADLADPEVPARLIAHALGLHGRIDILVNNAAAGRLSDGFLGEAPADWLATFNLNLMAAVRTMQAALPHLAAQRGVIVNVTSVNSRMPSKDAASYGASKAALLNVGKAVAADYASRGVRVVTVSPGLTSTPMWFGPDGVGAQIAARTGERLQDVAQAAAARTPLQRFLAPEEVANCICFLASPRASGVTGTEVVVDGGVTPTM